MDLYGTCKICCKKHTILYVAKNELWYPRFGFRGGIICIECFRNRLGRDLTTEDFSKTAYGNFWIFANPWIINLLNNNQDVTSMCVKYLRWYIETFGIEPYFGYHLGYQRIRTECPQEEGYLENLLRRLS
jgi:hypothetical protein